MVCNFQGLIGNEFVYGCVDFYTRLAISSEICFFSTLTFCSFAKLITDQITFSREEEQRGQNWEQGKHGKKQIRCLKSCRRISTSSANVIIIGKCLQNCFSQFCYIAKNQDWNTFKNLKLRFIIELAQMLFKFSPEWVQNESRIGPK